MDWEGKYHVEIHSAHFGASKSQVTLHSGVFFYRDDASCLQMQSFCTVSDSLHHDASAVWAHLKPVIDYVKTVVSNVEELSVQSDGPVTQYRNKTNFYLFKDFCKTLNLKSASWNFTAPGHSKGPADQVGGTCKETMKKSVCCGKDILNAKEFITFFQEKETKVILFNISLENIEKVDLLLPKEENFEAVKETMKISQIVWNESKKNELKFWYLTCVECNNFTIFKHYTMPKSKLELEKKADSPPNTKIGVREYLAICKPLKISDFKVNDWVVVIFDKIWYPGIVKKNWQAKIINKIYQ